MCTGIEIAAMAMSAGGAFANSKASKQAYAAQAQVNRNNAQIAEWQAEDALVRGDKAAQGVRMRGNQLKGMQRARLAANGVDLGAGSALEVLTDTDYFTAVDAGTTLDNAAREAWALRNQAMNFTAEASLMQNRSDNEHPWMAAGTSLLTGASKVSSNWYTPSSGTTSGTRATFGGVDYQKRGDY